jgi:hypothetical protein
MALDLTVCGCCTCIVPAGEPVLDVISVEGNPLVICANCGPRP